MAIKPTDKFKLKLKIWMRLSGFSLLLEAWKNKQEVVYTVLLSSLMINILSLIFPLALLQVYDRIIRYHSISTLIWLMVLVLSSLILNSFLKITRSYVSTWEDAKFEHNLGRQAFNSLLRSRLSLYEKEGSGRHLKRITALSSLRQFYAGQALTTLVDFPFIIIYLTLIAYIANWLVLVPIGIVLVSIVTTSINTSSFQKKLKERQDHDERRLNFIIETISKIHTIKSNTMEAQMLRRYERLQKASSSYDYQISQGSTALVTDGLVLSQGSVALMAAVGSIMVFNGYLSVGILAACILLAGQCLQPVNSLLNMWGRLQIIKLAHKELNKLLYMIPEDSKELQTLTQIRGKIEFKNVSFRHTEREPFILKNISLTINPGETVSISGKDFSGKSTLLSLILKLTSPTDGSVFLDDINLNTLGSYSVRRYLGYMPEKAVLFKGTILQNLTMFNEEHEGLARQLSQQIGLGLYIEQFPEGFDTRVGYQATEILPRGLIQLMVIVRALASNPKIILFDEANLNIDIVGDKKIIELLKEWQKDRTLILVSHRPSITALAQKKFILEQGHLSLVEEHKKPTLVKDEQ